VADGARRGSAHVTRGRVWRKALGGEDRERAFAAAEVATLLDLRRALRNGTVWIEHSLAFRSRETLFIPQRQWEESRRTHYRRPSLLTEPGAFLELWQSAPRLPSKPWHRAPPKAYCVSMRSCI
jgi:hypothetical protein